MYFFKKLLKDVAASFKGEIRVKGYARLRCVAPNGKVKWDTGFMRNTITNASFAVVSGLVGNTGAQTAFTYLAVGTDNTAESASQTTLVAELTDTGLARAAATVSRVTTTQTNDTLQLYHEWTATGSKTIEEIGAFNAASSGTMFGRKLTTSKSVGNGDKLQGTYQFIFS